MALELAEDPHFINADMRADPSGEAVIAYAAQQRSAGKHVVIVTLINIEGSAPRGLGAQMAVSEDGRFTGAISSGCLERAILNEAHAVITRGRGGIVRYGKGSQHFDISLPCGSGLELLYTFNPSQVVLEEALDAFAKRRPHALEFSAQGAGRSTPEQTRAKDGAFARRYFPKLRIVAAGVGEELVVLSRVVAAAGYEFCAVSQEEETLRRCSGGDALRLHSPAALPAVPLDAWSAFVCLSHEREWAAALTAAALASPAFYIGAVGAARTQADRKAALQRLGLDNEIIARLKAPIGLIPSVRDPSALAVSVLAEIVMAWGAKASEP